MKNFRALLLLGILLLLASLFGCVTGVEEALPEPPPPQPEPQEPVLPVVGDITPDRTGRVKAMARRNEDTVGWLVVPGTTIDDVIAINPERNNNYYLNHDFDRQPDSNGIYCADYRCEFGGGSRVQLSRNTILYGHNFTDDPDGELFDQLKKFKDAAFARDNPYIFFSTEREDMAWEVFAVYDTTVNFPYVLPTLPWDDYDRIIDVALQASIYDYGVRLTADDRILTLSTCTFSVPGNEALPLVAANDYRFVVMARLLAPDEPLKERADFTIKGDILFPDLFPEIVVTR